MRGRANKACDVVRHQTHIRHDLALEPADTRDSSRQQVGIVIKALDRLRVRMTAKEWHVVEGMVLRGKTCRELADEAGVTYQAVQQRSELVMPYVKRCLREALA